MSERQKLLSNERDIELNIIKYTDYSDISDDNKNKNEILFNVNRSDNIDITNNQSKCMELEEIRQDSSHLKCQVGGSDDYSSSISFLEGGNKGSQSDLHFTPRSDLLKSKAGFDSLGQHDTDSIQSFPRVSFTPSENSINLTSDLKSETNTGKFKELFWMGVEGLPAILIGLLLNLFLGVSFGQSFFPISWYIYIYIYTYMYMYIYIHI
jgi:hypothetical protein